jgi:hypothetical protein
MTRPVYPKGQPDPVVRARWVIHTNYKGAPVTITPAHRLRADHPLVKSTGAESWTPEPPLDFED